MIAQGGEFDPHFVQPAVRKPVTVGEQAGQHLAGLADLDRRRAGICQIGHDPEPRVVGKAGAVGEAPGIAAARRRLISENAKIA